MKNIFLLLLLLWTNNLFAQHEYDNWYFGSNAAISFIGGPPANIPNGALNTTEGCSAISDSAGNLLFYTDGVTVYNASHLQMPNGTGLNGGNSSSQSSLIIPDPSNAKQYYIFTIPNSGGGAGLCYSMVNMTLQGGLGDVTAVKNVPLISPCDEKLTGTLQSNGIGYWVITHKLSSSSNAYYAYPITSAGVGAPVISNTGVMNSLGAPWTGCMRVSPDGLFIADCLYAMSSVEISNFDASTGIVSNSFIYNTNNNDFMYGVDFSASGDKLYVGTVDYPPSHLYQLDMRAGSQAAITASAVLIGTTNDLTGTVQIGPDHKIYWTNYNTHFLDVVNNPELPGASCNYIAHGYTLNTNDLLGLPNFISGALHPILPTPLFNSQNTYFCPGNCTDFNNLSVAGQTYTWLFPGGVPSIDTSTNPQNICYFNPGTFPVTLIATNNNGTDTLTLPGYITVYTPLQFSALTQIGDTIFSVPGFSTYSWYLDSTQIQGANNYYYIATQSGNYNVVVTDNNGCNASAELINVIASIDAVNTGYGEFKATYSAGNIQLNFISYSQSPIEVELNDAVGNEIFYKKIHIEKGKNELEIPGINISPGIYFIKITNSYQALTRKIFIRQN